MPSLWRCPSLLVLAETPAAILRQQAADVRRDPSAYGLSGEGPRMEFYNPPLPDPSGRGK
jgi:hypothetical protein